MQGIFIKVESPHKVTRRNLFKPETMEGLLAVKDISKEDYSLKNEIIRVVEYIKDNMKPEDFPEYQRVMEEQGLSHPMDGIRNFALDALLTDGLQREYEYEPILELLKLETNPDIQDKAIHALLVESKASDVDRFESELSGDSVGLKRFAIKLMTEHPDKEDVQVFLHAYETDQPSEIYQSLKSSLIELTSTDYPGTVPSFLPKIQQNNLPRVRELAFEVLGNSHENEYYEPILNTILTESLSVQLEVAAVKSLAKTISSKNYDSFYQVYEGKKINKTLERLGFEILPTNENNVFPLIKYLESPHTTYPNRAINLIGRSVSSTQEKQLQELVESYVQRAIDNQNAFADDPEPILGAIAALKKLNKESFLKLFYKLLRNVDNSNISNRILEAAEQSPHSKANFQFLKDQLLNKKELERVSITSANVIDDYGIPALEPLLKARNLHNQQNVIQAVENAILRITRDNEEAFDTLLPIAFSNDENRDISTQAINNYLDLWNSEYDYGNSKYRFLVKDVSAETGNSKLSTKASTIYDSWVENKKIELEDLGKEGSFHSRDNFKKLEKIKDGIDDDPIVKEAAKDALKKLKSRKADYEEEQRQLETARQEAAEAARQAAKDDSYDYGGGGGFSTGGGGGF